MRSLPTHIAKGLCVERPVLITKIERVKGEKWMLHTDDDTDTDTHTHTHTQKPFDMVVIAVPTEQTIPLLEQTHPHTNTHAHTQALQGLRAVQSVPCLSIMVAYPNPLPTLPPHTHTHTPFTSDIIASARRDDTKAAGRVCVPGVAERWVIHGTCVKERGGLIAQPIEEIYGKGAGFGAVLCEEGGGDGGGVVVPVLEGREFFLL
jgi:predicted NAD/FAD-dependent oxidoreductase